MCVGVDDKEKVKVEEEEKISENNEKKKNKLIVYISAALIIRSQFTLSAWKKMEPAILFLGQDQYAFHSKYYWYISKQ